MLHIIDGTNEKGNLKQLFVCLVFCVPLEILPEMNNWISLQFARCLHSTDDVNKEWIVKNSKDSLEYMQSMSLSLSNRVKIVNFSTLPSNGYFKKEEWST